MEGVVCEFSRSGEQLAVSGADGEVKIWDFASETLKQRLKPTSAAIACLSWSRLTKKRKKRKSATSGAEITLLAVGVANEVIVWNVLKGERETKLSLAHCDSVKCVDWGTGNDHIYTGSSDRHVTEWNMGTGHETHKWKADRHSVEAVCCYDNGGLLLTAGRTIKLWNLEDYTMVKKFTGHATLVRRMEFVSECWWLSSAEDDRVINLCWLSFYKRDRGQRGRHHHHPRVMLCSDGESKTAAVSLTCESEVRLAHASLDNHDDQQLVKVVGICSEGLVHLFKCSLTNQIAAPVSAFSTIQFVSTATKGSTPSPLPVLASFLPPSSNSLTVAHTSAIRPSFETIDFDQSERRRCLVRETKFAGGYLLSSDREKDAKVGGATPKKVTILGPGNMTLRMDKLPARVDKRVERHNVDDIPLKDRLEASEVKRSHGRAQPPSADSLTQLLVQSVASGDMKLLEEVLRVTKEKIVMATVRKIPLTVVLPFLKKLIELLQKSPARGLELSVWIRAIFTAHTAYLMTVPNLMDSLSGLYQLLDSRVGTFSRLCRLQGKLHLVLAQQSSLLESGGEGGHANIAMAINTPLLTVNAGEDSIIGNHVGGDDDNSDETDESASSEVDVSSLSDDNSNQSDSDVSMETETT